MTKFPEEKQKIFLLNTVFPSFYTFGPGSTDPNECGSGSTSLHELLINKQGETTERQIEARDKQ